MEPGNKIRGTFYLSPVAHIQVGIFRVLRDVKLTHVERGCGQIAICEGFIPENEKQNVDFTIKILLLKEN